VVLEVAHLLARTEAGSRTVFALFTEEETGLLGSRQFVDGLDPRVRARLEGVVVMDAVGFASHEPHSQKAPPPLQRFAPDVGDFLTVLTIRDDAAFSDQLVSMRNAVAPGLPLVTFSPPRLVADQLRDLWRSDHAPFWSAGLPALFLTDTGNFRNPHYHRPDDVPATLDGEFLASVAEVLAALFAAPP
jgi:Zn-dependent M28 family amino/carboxypeptidase